MAGTLYASTMSAQRQHEQRQAEGELNDSVEQTVEERAEALAHDMVDEWRAINKLDATNN